MLASFEIQAKNVMKNDVIEMLRYVTEKYSIDIRDESFSNSESLTAFLQNRLQQRKARFEVSVDFHKQ